MTAAHPPLRRVAWPKTHRIIRSRFPPIDLFEDIADPSDWAALAAAEAKTNPRLAATIGNLDLVPAHRRVSGPGASYAMAPFVHVTPDRPSRFSRGHWGVYYAGDRLQVALAETIHHHARFMARTAEPPGWTSEFRELVGRIDAPLHDLRGAADFAACLDPDDYGPAQALAETLRAAGSDGLVYPSVRHPAGSCIAAFWPDVAGAPVQGAHFAYHWDGARVDWIKDATAGRVYAVRP